MTVKCKLLISRVFPPQVGGSGRFLWEIYRRQDGAELVTAAGECAGSEGFDGDAPFPIVRMPLHFRNWGLLPLGFRSYASVFLHLRKIVRRQRIAAVHAATLLPEGFLAWMLHHKYGLPYVCFVHGEELGCAATSRELSWMTDHVVRGASRLIANSANTRELILKAWPAADEKIAVVTPGVDATRFCPAERDDQVRRRLGWAGRRVVLTVGRLQERKGHDRLIEALPAIRREIPDILYAIVGDDERRARLASLAVATGVQNCVKFHDELADAQLIECYQQCDLMALPNREINGDIEGFGMVLVEAQACGRPVLAGASGGTVETMRPGETGRLVDCTRPEPLAAALIEMLSSPLALEEMGVAARQWMVRNFDWSVIAQRAREAMGESAAQPLSGGRAVAGVELESGVL